MMPSSTGTVSAYPERPFVLTPIEIPVERRVALYQEAVSEIRANTPIQKRNVIKARLREQFDVTVEQIESVRRGLSVAEVGVSAETLQLAEEAFCPDDTRVCPVHHCLYLLDSGDRNLDCRQCLEETHRLMDAALASSVAREQRGQVAPVAGAPVQSGGRRLDGSAWVATVAVASMLVCLACTLFTLLYSPLDRSHAWNMRLTTAGGR